MAIVLGSENVFEDLGFSAEEAASLQVRTDLMLKLRHYILQRGWSQEQAASFFSETQSQISNLMGGEVTCFNVDGLIGLLMKAGMQVRVEVVSKVG